MRINAKEYVILIDGKPNRYYKDGQIKTYMTRDNAVKEAKKLSRKHARVEVGKFSAIDLEEVKEGEE